MFELNAKEQGILGGGRVAYKERGWEGAESGARLQGDVQEAAPGCLNVFFKRKTQGAAFGWRMSLGPA